MIAPLVLALSTACHGAHPVPADASIIQVEIGTRSDGAIFTPWTSGQSVALVWGPQGGVMVTPAVAIDAGLFSGGEPALVAQLTNIDVSTGQPIPGFMGFGPIQTPFAQLDTRLVNGPIFDQLGWTDISGTHVLLKADVSGSGVTGHGEVEIVLASPGARP